MFYRFEINKKYFLNNIEWILNKLNEYLSPFKTTTFHIIVPGLKVAEIDSIIKNNIHIGNNIRLYSGYLLFKNDMFNLYIPKDIIHITTDDRIMRRLIAQEICGYNMDNIYYNIVLNVDENGHIKNNKLNINIKFKDIFEYRLDTVYNDNKILGNGIICNECCNPICNYTNINKQKCIDNLCILTKYNPDYMKDILINGLFNNYLILDQLKSNQRRLVYNILNK